MKFYFLIKYILFITLSILILSCQHTPEPLGCKSDKDCYDDSYYCYTANNNDLGICYKETCKTLNPDCGKGICKNIYDNYYCECNEGDRTGYGNNSEYAICIDNTCEDSKSCYGTVINGYSPYKKNIQVYVCSPNNKCVEHCNSNNDCIGKNEYCLVGGNEDRPDACEEFIEDHDENFYLNIYNRDDNTDTPKYSKFCNNNEDCRNNNNTDFVCDTQRHCVPPCQTNQDCIDDKFSYGNICDTENNFCVKELPQTVDSESKAANSIIQEFGIDNCEIPEEEFFNTNCGDYNINSEEGQEFQTFITVISIENENYNYQHRSANVDSKSEHDNLIEMAKAKARKFLNTNFKNYDFKIYKAEIYNGYHEWSETNKLVNQIRLDYSREWGGIPVLGADALFTLNLSMEYISMEIAFLPLEPKAKDQALIDELDAQNEQIKQYLIQYDSEDETNSRYAYFISENGPELVFILQVYNAFYFLKRKDYDGSYESVENAVKPQTSQDPCNPNPCTTEPHQTICHSVDEASDYYCTCEDGYVSNANGQTPVCIEEEK